MTVFREKISIFRAKISDDFFFSFSHRPGFSDFPFLFPDFPYLYYCRMKARDGNIKKTQRSFNEQKIQIRIQKCLRLFRLRSSEKYKKKVFNLTSHVLVALSRGKITQATIGANSIRRR